MSPPRWAELPVFVYGTLRRQSPHPLARRLADEGRYLGEARCQGQLYRVAHYPGWVPGPGWVTGELYRLSPALLAALDSYEECGPGFSEPWEYRRERHQVWLGKEAHLAFIYRYNRPTGSLTLLGSGDFFLT
ncbi:gamma-glutamylcyclotransferase family protein [Gallaecimonas pentaromativorans]|uniref:gamma-glutamylcyclotransferase family protein n=1 Tax=Gallaecimonas pentaromativorans TaxID=584787 RepID=UPI003A94BB2B